uniref:DIX domain-containing protein n=1 Tax=Panagrolaimus sp. ES5 TaxID=591445 RepID=A0AC34G2V2_9BILA
MPAITLPLAFKATAELSEPQFTKVYYYIDMGTCPFLTIINVPLSHLTLQKFKESLPKTNFKYFNHLRTEDEGLLKSEINNDSEKLLPIFAGGKVIMTLLTNEKFINDKSK